MRTTPIEEDGYYHIFNRGNQKQQLFFDTRDWVRFMFLALHFQSPHTFRHIDRQVDYFIHHGVFNMTSDDTRKVITDRHVELVNFSLMPNHFHMTLHNIKAEGVPLYIHRISNAFGKYYNTKYDKTGHVFQGTYKAVPVLDDNQLSYLSAYIHRNSRDLTEWKDREHLYPWSSFTDYGKNRWGELLAHDIITDKFTNFDDYKQFIETSGKRKLKRMVNT